MLALAVHERRNDVAKCRQRKVNLRALFQSVTGGPGLGLPLAACEVHQVQLALPAEQWMSIDVLKRHHAHGPFFTRVHGYVCV